MYFKFIHTQEKIKEPIQRSRLQGVRRLYKTEHNNMNLCEDKSLNSVCAKAHRKASPQVVYSYCVYSECRA